MPAHLECHTPPFAGKALIITADKPVVIKTNKADESAGDVRVEIAEGGYVLSNRSRLHCTINGVPHTRTKLAPGDRIVIGKQAFTLVIDDDHDATGTQALVPPEPLVAQLCSVCDQLFGAADRQRGWVSGERRICRRCLSKGVKPENLAHGEPVQPDPAAIPAPPTFLDGPTDRPTESNHDLDVIDVGPVILPDEESTSSLAAPDRAHTESDRQRRQRRLSASRLAQIEPTNVGKPSLFSKVGSVFANREERRRLEALEEERRGLIEQAGRLALSEHNGFGVPEHLMGALLKGVVVSLRLQDLTIPAVERWRALRQRVALLDAEMAALRATLGLGPDPGNVSPPEPLRADRLERQNRTFAALDAVGTEDLTGEEANVDEVAIDPSAPGRARGETRRPDAKPAAEQGDRPGTSDRRQALRRRR